MEVVRPLSADESRVPASVYGSAILGHWNSSRNLTGELDLSNPAYPHVTASTVVIELRWQANAIAFCHREACLARVSVNHRCETVLPPISASARLGEVAPRWDTFSGAPGSR
jgi:hypothetical protein